MRKGQVVINNLMYNSKFISYIIWFVSHVNYAIKRTLAHCFVQLNNVAFAAGIYNKLISNNRGKSLNNILAGLDKNFIYINFSLSVVG